VSIRPANRAAIEAHVLAPRITLVEGSSTAPATVAAVREKIAPGERVLVVLDSDHSRAHVRAELECYAPLVAPGGYLVVCDGIMAAFAASPRGRAEWATDNPIAAVEDFLASRDDFVEEEPGFPFNEGAVASRVTYWPRCFLRRIGAPVEAVA
jgi:cephalosporin hydroxylase